MSQASRRTKSGHGPAHAHTQPALPSHARPHPDLLSALLSWLPVDSSQPCLSLGTVLSPGRCHHVPRAEAPAPTGVRCARGELPRHLPGRRVGPGTGLLCLQRYVHQLASEDAASQSIGPPWVSRALFRPRRPGGSQWYLLAAEVDTGPRPVSAAGLPRKALVPHPSPTPANSLQHPHWALLSEALSARKLCYPHLPSLLLLLKRQHGYQKP